MTFHFHAPCPIAPNPVSALMNGTYEQVLIQNEAYGFARKSQKETKLVFINIADKPCTLRADFDGKHFEVTVPAFSSQITDF